MTRSVRETNATRVARSLRPTLPVHQARVEMLPRIEKAFWCPPEVAVFCQRLLFEEKRPRMGRCMETDREMVHWDRTDWPELWDLSHWMLRQAAPHAKLVQATYVIRYRLGVELTPHRDSGATRLIVLARAPDAGGTLTVDGSPVSLEVGDAAVFSDGRTHAVSKIQSGERWTITMGLG